MNKPLINPWMFYWAEVVTVLKAASIILAISLLLICAVAVTLLIFKGEIYLEDDDDKNIVRIFKYTLIGGIVFMLAGAFIPSSDTIYKMVIAQNVTEENLRYGKEGLREIVDYICDSIEETKEGD